MSRAAAVTGLRVEAAIARRAGLVAGASGAVPSKARELAETFVRSGASALVSFGVAGALEPALRPGSIVLADAVITDEAWIACDPDWLARISDRLPGARIGPVLGSARIIGTCAEKQASRATGALAVDMESGAVAQVASAYRLPLLVVRTIVDGAADEIPAAAAAALQPGQGATAFLAGLARQPAAMFPLIGLAWRMVFALRALNRTSRALGPDLALL